MHCPCCDTEANRQNCRVTQSRNDTIESKIRQRKCLSCGHKWWTCEVDLPPGSVRYVQFEDDEDNLYNGPIRLTGFKRVTFS